MAAGCCRDGEQYGEGDKLVPRGGTRVVWARTTGRNASGAPHSTPAPGRNKSVLLKSVTPLYIMKSHNRLMIDSRTSVGLFLCKECTLKFCIPVCSTKINKKMINISETIKYDTHKANCTGMSNVHHLGTMTRSQNSLDTEFNLVTAFDKFSMHHQETAMKDRVKATVHIVIHYQH